jgi:hypothetical protein
MRKAATTDCCCDSGRASGLCRGSRHQSHRRSDRTHRPNRPRKEPVGRSGGRSGDARVRCCRCCRRCRDCRGRWERWAGGACRCGRRRDRSAASACRHPRHRSVLRSPAGDSHPRVRCRSSEEWPACCPRVPDRPRPGAHRRNRRCWARRLHRRRRNHRSTLQVEQRPMQADRRQRSAVRLRRPRQRWMRAFPGSTPRCRRWG